MRVIPNLVASDNMVGFRFAVGRKAHWFVGSNKPAARENADDCVPAQIIGHAMGIALGHLGHQESVDQMDAIVLGKRPGIDHFFVALEGHPEEW